MQSKTVKAAFVRGKRAALSKKDKKNPFHPTVSRAEYETWVRAFKKWTEIWKLREQTR